MKNRFPSLIFVLCCFFLLAATAQAQNPTEPQDMPISISKPKPPGQKGLRRPVGDGNVWTFRIVPEPGLVWVEGPNWSYPGEGEGADPDWGQWSGGDGQMWLSWSSPQKAAPFKIKMMGKVGRHGSGGGGPIDVEASWEGDVEKKTWEPEPEFEITGGKMTMPQSQLLAPYLPNPVIVGAGQPVLAAVTDAIDKDTWKLGEETGEEDDTVKYEWTASGGGFITPQNPGGTAPKAETQTTTWKAPLEPGEYTLSCNIDDEPKEIPEEETGDRDDDALPTRTVKVWVVDIKFSPGTIYMYEGDTRDVTVTVTPEAMSSYLTFETTNPAVATSSGNAPELTVTGIHAGNTQLQAKYGGVVLKTASITVKSEDDEDLDDDGDPNVTDPDDNGDGIPDDPGEKKIWTSGAGIVCDGFTLPLSNSVRMAPGGTLLCEVASASDSDFWRQGTASGTEADSIQPYEWQAASGVITVDPTDFRRASYTAPMEEGTYSVRCTIDDGGITPTGDLGDRNDSSRTFTLLIEVTKPCKITLDSDNVKASSAHLFWNPCEDNDFTNYVLHRSTEENFTPSEATRLTTITDRDLTEYQDTGLSPDTQYFYVLMTTHSGQSTESRTSLKTRPFDVEFEGLARACAGGVAVDGVHDFTLVATAKNGNGAILPNTQLKFSFENNKAYDYQAGDRPDNQTGELHRAKYLPVTINGQELVEGSNGEEVTVVTDAEGKVSIHVLSSDVISNDIKIIAEWVNSQQEEKVVGSKACEFASALNYRRFGIIGESGDTGWKFDGNFLFEENGDKMPAKLWLKIQKDPSIAIDTDYFLSDGETPRQPNDWGNWNNVVGHRLLVRISEIILADGTDVRPERFGDYITILNDSNIPVDDIEVESRSDGSAQVWLKSAELISECLFVSLEATEMSQYLP